MRRPQACVSNSASLEFSSGRPTLGSRICDVLSNENIWAWARGGSWCRAYLVGIGIEFGRRAAELSPELDAALNCFYRSSTSFCHAFQVPGHLHLRPPFSRPAFHYCSVCLVLESIKVISFWLNLVNLRIQNTAFVLGRIGARAVNFW